MMALRSRADQFNQIGPPGAMGLFEGVDIWPHLIFSLSLCVCVCVCVCEDAQLSQVLLVTPGSSRCWALICLGL